MIESSFLLAMQRIIGCIKIQDDLLRLLAVVIASQEMIDEKSFAQVLIVADLFVPTRWIDR